MGVWDTRNFSTTLFEISTVRFVIVSRAIVIDKTCKLHSLNFRRYMWMRQKVTGKKSRERALLRWDIQLDRHHLWEQKKNINLVFGKTHKKILHCILMDKLIVNLNYWLQPTTCLLCYLSVSNKLHIGLRNRGNPWKGKTVWCNRDSTATVKFKLNQSPLRKKVYINRQPK